MQYSPPIGAESALFQVAFVEIGPSADAGSDDFPQRQVSGQTSFKLIAVFRSAFGNHFPNRGREAISPKVRISEGWNLQIEPL